MEIVPTKEFMTDMLTKATVLVLNRKWQAINIRTPQEAFCMMATNVATALDIETEFRVSSSEFRASNIRPVTWEEWITLPIRSQDNAVQTVRGPIRVPTVIVAANFVRVPKKRPKLCAKMIRPPREMTFPCGFGSDDCVISRGKRAEGTASDAPAAQLAWRC